MLTPRDWKSLRFSRSKLARVSEVLMAVATASYLGLAMAFFQLAQDVAAIRGMSLGAIIKQGWDGINPQQNYPGTFVLAFEPVVLGIVSLALAAVVGMFFALLVAVRRRNERFMVFLDRYQSSFSGTMPEDEDIDRLIGSV